MNSYPERKPQPPPSSYRTPIILALVFILSLLFVTNFDRAPTSIQKVFLPTIVTPPTCPAETCESLNCTGAVIEADRSRPSIPSSEAIDVAATEEWAFDTKRDAQNYGLSLAQCDAAFPGLFVEIEAQVDMRKDRPIVEQELEWNRETWGGIRCMIYDGQLYVISTDHADMRRSRQFSTMLAISRALLGVSNLEAKIPDIEFVISIEDFTVDYQTPAWAYDRTHAQNQTWLMPDFGFWGWPEPGVGAYGEVRRRMADLESEYASFTEKVPKLFWRGAIVPAVAPVLRQHLVDQAQGQSWADVDVLVWNESDVDKQKRVNIEDHCRYQYLANTEGRAWSGRLKYIQNCESVVVAHKMKWIVPHAYLMIPEGPKQNFVQVEPDFSDLREKMDYLTSHPEEAERIARNSALTFRDRYLTPAAEACYWRKMIHGWSQVSFKPRFYDDDGKWRGVPFDSYVLMRQLEWQPT